MSKDSIKKSTLLKKTIPYLRYEKKLFFLTIVLSFVISLLSASTPFVTKAIVDDYLDIPNPNYDMVIVLLGVYMGITILLLLARYAFTFVNNLTGMRIEKRVREVAMKKINMLPVDYYNLEPDGKIVAKITSDTAGIRTFYVKMFDIFNAVLNIIIVYIGVMLLKPILGLIMLVIVPILIVWITLYRKWVHKFFVATRETSSRITGKLNENIVGAQIIEDFNLEDKMMGEYDDLLWLNIKNERKAQRLNNSFGFELLGLIKRTVIIVLLMYLGFNSLGVGGTTLSLGLVSALVDNLDKMINPFSTIFDNLNELEDSMVGAMRAYAFIDEANDSNIDTGKEAPNEIEGTVEFKNVNFAYIKGTNVLNDFSFKTDAGRTIGIVGATGAGKSSLMNLLLAYNDYEEGSILVDGEEVNSFNKQSYRKNIGIVLQVPALFCGTIKSNITMEREYSDEEVINSLKIVGGEHLLKKSELGVNTPVSFRGENLSLGEKQLIAFARVILRNPKILVLDEATSNIDSETEEKIKNAVNVVSKGRTTFIIAHRLSTIKHADEILVLDHGRLVGQGLHDDLYDTCDIYKTMYDSQFKGKRTE